ncbi:MAG: ribonuclease P protein component [Wenzhouxiangella sp.]
MLDLPRSARLLVGPEFKRVFESRQRYGNALFRIHFVEAKQARLGIAVSRRVSGSAVVRNRIRRQIRESFRLRRPQLAAMDFVVLAQPAAARQTRPQLRAALDQLWQRFT